jgi:hypothetical protein
MKELLSLIKEYSPGVVFLIAIGSVLIFVMKLAVEKSIASGFDAHSRYLQRRSTFEEKVLTDRFEKVIGLSARLERVMTNLNRLRSDQPAQDGFMQLNEVVPLTEIFEELTVHRLILTEDFYLLFRRKAELTLRAANSSDSIELDEVAAEWVSLNNEIRSVIDRDFGVSKIRW